MKPPRLQVERQQVPMGIAGHGQTRWIRDWHAGPSKSRLSALTLALANAPGGLRLVRPSKLAHEQVTGHWLRTAHDNGLRDPGWLLVPAAKRQHARVRVCPQCLSRPSPIWPEAWEDRARPVCIEHGNWLVDTCQGCTRPLRQSSVRFLSCRFGHDLRQFLARPLSADAQRALMSDGVPLQVLLWLGALAAYGLVGKPLKKASRQTMNEIVDLAESGAEIVNNWPHALLRILDRCRQDVQQPGSISLLNAALPGLTKALGLVRDAEWRSKLGAAVEAYAEASRQTPAPLIGRNVPGTQVATMTGMAREFGVRSERLTAAVDKLPSSLVATRLTAGGRCRRLVSLAAAVMAQQALADEITTKQAARLLRITAVRVEQLVADRKLQASNGRLSRHAVVALHQSLEDSLARGNPPADAVELGYALRYWIPVDRTGSLIEAIRSGALKLYRGSSAGPEIQLLVSQSRLCGWTSTLPAADRLWLTIPECAEHLQLKQEVVYHLVRVGVIPTEVIRAERRKARVVKVEALHFFEDHIEPLSRAAMRVGVDHRQGLDWAKANSVELVSGPRIDGGRQYFVRREPVLDVAGA